VDNGDTPTAIEVVKTHDAAQAHGTPITTISPGSMTMPILNSTKAKLTPVVPSKFMPVQER